MPAPWGLRGPSSLLAAVPRPRGQAGESQHEDDSPTLPKVHGWPAAGPGRTVNPAFPTAVIDVDDSTSDEEDGGSRGMQRCRSSTNLVKSSGASRDSPNSTGGGTISDVSPVPEGSLDTVPHPEVFKEMVRLPANPDLQLLDEDMLDKVDAGTGNSSVTVSELRSFRAPLGEITNIVGNSTLLTSEKPLSEDTIMVCAGDCAAAVGAKRKKAPSAKSAVAPRLVQQPAMAYSADVLRSMLAQERHLSPPADCMANQVDINARSRSILNNWLIDVHTGYHHRPETLFLSVNIVDRYMACQQVSREMLQLVGITATLIAAKFEEVQPPGVNDLVYITENSYTGQEVLAMECQVLSDLQFDIAVPTAAHFLQHFVAERQCCAAPGRALEAQENLAWHLLELALLDIHMLRFTPSRVAAAALMLSNELHSYRPSWPMVLSHISGYRTEDLRECAVELWRLLEMTPAPPLPMPEAGQHLAMSPAVSRQGDWASSDVIIHSDHRSPRRVSGVPASWR